MTELAREWEEVAYHEAGHAVISWRLGVKFKYVTITPKGDSAGHVFSRPEEWFRPDIEWTDRTRLRLEKEIVISFAGQLAQAKFRGEHPHEGMESDNDHAVYCAFLLGSQKVKEAFLHYCWCSSEAWVSSMWQTITAVADALLDKKTLTYHEMIEVVLPGAAEPRASLSKAARWKEKPKGE